MRKIPFLIVAFALPALTLTAIADDAVKTAQPPYKPGRQIADEVKTSKPPYKPGRQAEEGKSQTDEGKSERNEGKSAPTGKQK